LTRLNVVAELEAVVVSKKYDCVPGLAVKPTTVGRRKGLARIDVAGPALKPREEVIDEARVENVSLVNGDVCRAQGTI